VASSEKMVIQKPDDIKECGKKVNKKIRRLAAA
jgi:hypothetical protein